MADTVSEEGTELSTSDRFRRFLERHQGERHLVVMQDYPDPDAISSALAYQTLAEAHGIVADLCYQGEISHPENIALVRVLEIELKRLGPEADLSVYSGSVLVDTQGATTSLADKLKAIKPLVVVDHHTRQGNVEAEFVDLRSVGATATIFVDYLRSGIVALEASNHSHSRLATALMHGIRTDTQNLVTARPEDFEAAAFLSHYFSPGMLGEILGVKRSRRVMDCIQQALSKRRQVDNLTLAGLGYLRKKDRDIIPQVADFLLTEEDVHTVVAYGVVLNEDGSESIVGSLRSTKVTMSPDEFLRECLGTDEAGRPYGGGRRNAGGFEIPVGFISGSFDEEYDELKWRLIDRKICQEILGKLGKLDQKDSKA